MTKRKDDFRRIPYNLWILVVFIVILGTSLFLGGYTIWKNVTATPLPKIQYYFNPVLKPNYDIINTSLCRTETVNLTPCPKVHGSTCIYLMDSNGLPLRNYTHTVCPPHEQMYSSYVYKSHPYTPTTTEKYDAWVALEKIERIEYNDYIDNINDDFRNATNTINIRLDKYYNTYEIGFHIVHALLALFGGIILLSGSIFAFDFLINRWWRK